MTEDERLKSMDASLAGIERSSARVEHWAERMDKEVQLMSAFMADQRTFTNQVVARMERSARDGMRELSRMNDNLDRQGRELERQGREHERQAERWDAESRMGRAALLRVLDRLDEIGPGPSMASD